MSMSKQGVLARTLLQKEYIDSGLSPDSFYRALDDINKEFVDSTLACVLHFKNIDEVEHDNA